MRKLSLGVLTFFICVYAWAQDDDSLMIRRIADEILLHSKAYDNLHDLTKNIGARLTASPQFYKAEQWGLKVLQQSGANKAWLQECMVPHWVRGGKDIAEARVSGASMASRNITPEKKTLDILALGNSIGTGPKGVTANVIEVKSFDDLEIKKDKVKGRIVFYNYKFNPTFVGVFQAYGDAVRYRSSGASQAAKYGAAAVIVRSMSESTDNNPHTGALRYDTTLPQIPAVAVGLKDADWLSSTLVDKKVQVFLKTGGKFLPDTIGHNVIGELMGTEFPDQIITIGGHLDSWDPAEGAHDDGAGVVHSIEVLRAFKALSYKPKHTIRFVLFANEENGLRGGTKYADEAKAKNEKHVFALESDGGGFTPRGFSFGGTPEQLKKMQSWVPLLLPYGVYQITDGGGGADIGPLNRVLQTPVAELAPDSQRYFDVHHARSDVFENVNKRELELGAVNLAALIYLVDKYGLPPTP
ncbi:MAG TPA: M20/M25/M40 family metallo-hydrolase [Chitinophagaceae bacterium]|nr:M20/M25/M40 family metallo-hydrolase [Chitinophagaceae bacterium]